eukprot:TRINITY_DN3236_c1_g1_i1.p1 TRINITY_DN3236_c1_g1~~TRINITY_DN3236_c1_g1_i1.p1  ORF type:complete len:367 (+),score=70.41 TRINITY_DN3236_c1_g1_i1:78-1103(+)
MSEVYYLGSNLLAALQNGRVDDFDRLLVMGASTEYCSDSDGLRCLHVAALKGDHLAIRKLIAYGAIPNAKNKKGRTPLEEAKDEETKKLLKEVMYARAPFVRLSHDPEPIAGVPLPFNACIYTEPFGTSVLEGNVHLCTCMDFEITVDKIRDLIHSQLRSKAQFAPFVSSSALSIEYQVCLHAFPETPVLSLPSSSLWAPFHTDKQMSKLIRFALRHAFMWPARQSTSRTPWVFIYARVDTKEQRQLREKNRAIYEWAVKNSLLKWAGRIIDRCETLEDVRSLKYKDIEGIVFPKDLMEMRKLSHAVHFLAMDMRSTWHGIEAAEAYGWMWAGMDLLPKET